MCSPSFPHYLFKSIFKNLTCAKHHFSFKRYRSQHEKQGHGPALVLVLFSVETSPRYLYSYDSATLSISWLIICIALFQTPWYT